MEKSLSKKMRLTLFLTIFMVLALLSMFSTSTPELENEKLQSFNRDWSVSINQNDFAIIDLPTLLDAEKFDQIVISQALPNDFSAKQTLLIRGSLQNIQVKLNGNIIYEKDFSSNLASTYASMYHFIPIPENSNGQLIEIILVSPYDNMSGTVNEIFYGSPSTIHDHIMAIHGYKFYIAISMLFISIVFIMSYILFFKNQQIYSLYIGFFGIFTSLWLVAESKILQLYINNDFLIGSLAYVAIAAAPIAAVAFLKQSIFDKDKYLFSGLCIIYTINLLAIFTLHMSSIFDFFETVIITIILIIIGLVIVTVSLIKKYLNDKSEINRNYLVIFTIFFVFMFFEFYIFINRDFNYTASYTTTGLVIVFFLILVFTLKTLTKRARDNFESSLYKEIANTDQLTKAHSRFAFEKDLDHLFYNSDDHLSLVYFDFDDLKFINDNYGHIEGDSTLVSGLNAIKQVFGDYGKCYRIGGDEFACLSQKITYNIFLELKQKLTDLLSQISKNQAYQLRISLGYTEKNIKIDSKPSDLLQKADSQMYLDKNKNKAQVQ